VTKKVVAGVFVPFFGRAAFTRLAKIAPSAPTVGLNLVVAKPEE
jgi:hypothetical protein